MRKSGSKAGDFPRYSRGPLIRGHAPRIPGDLPETHESWGICICNECRDRANTVAYYGDRGHRTYTAEVREAISWVHTDGWRSLSWHVGDDTADWLCRWCDLQDDPNEALAALVSMADLTWVNPFTPLNISPINRTRDTLYRATAP